MLIIKCITFVLLEVINCFFILPFTTINYAILLYFFNQATIFLSCKREPSFSFHRCNVTGENAFFTNLTLHLLISLKRFPVWSLRGQTHGKCNCSMCTCPALYNCGINLFPSVLLLSNCCSVKAGPRSVITDHTMQNPFLSIAVSCI